MKELITIGKNARIASQTKIDKKTKNNVLEKFLFLIEKNKNEILLANNKDISSASKKNIPENFISRLRLDKQKIESIQKSIKKIKQLDDPTNKIIEKWKRPNGLIISKISTPIGVIGIIYESRPNVTSDVASLCFKSGKCCDFTWWI
jgi:Gamma-glutamyl phosphate reductase